MLVRTFSDDAAPADGGADKSDGSEYSFEGYNVEFSTKVLLTPVIPSRSALATGQSVSTAFVLSPKEENHDELTRAEFDRINRDEDRREAINRILQTAAGSAVASINWVGQGIAPIGYVKGMAIVYAMVYCKLKAGDAAATDMAKANTGNAATDALAHLAPEFAAAGLANNVAGVDTLRHVFVLMFGLGMLESSGKHCVGADAGAKPPPVPETAEAGLFQLSFNARFGSPLMPQLFQHYRANPAGFLKIFQEGGVRCNAGDATNLGAGDAKEFQRLSKACPAFAAEFAAVGLRNIRQQWGPINRREPEIRPECDAMFIDVQNIVDAANLCPVVPT
jgi:hypothetical protein